jgi:aminopeptidase 2
LIIIINFFYVLSEIHQIFDAISYHKGASVIRMASAFLGEERFLSGVKRYLMKYKYGNASTDDLWQALSDETGNEVGRFMTIWTKVVGVSIIKYINYFQSII